uniref:Pentacotripeptide-repeat region of PRORP domain-containing protein n=1 Tax=Aegilops tauschii subsp. strangulata TaxID=200361 RepID=A0A453FH46_AEGTS
ARPRASPFTESALTHQLLRQGWRPGCRPQGVRRKSAPGTRFVERHHKRPLSTWEIQRAVKLFVKLRRCGVVPDDLTMVSFMWSCCAVGDIRLVEQLHKCMLQCKRSGRFDVTLSNALVDIMPSAAAQTLQGGCSRECLSNMCRHGQP